MNFEQWLASKNLESETLSDAMRTTLQESWRASLNPPTTGGGGTTKKTTPQEDYEAMMAEARQEEARQMKINSLVREALDCSPNKREEIDVIGRKALEGKWDEVKTELMLTRAMRPDAPTQLATGKGTSSAIVLEAAFAQATGTQGLEKMFPEKVLEAAWTQHRGGMTILPLIEACARQNGYRGTAAAKVNLEEVMRYAFRRSFDGDNFERRQDSGVSTISINGILNNVGNKKVKVAFNAVDQTWREFSAIGSVSDFKQMSSYSLTGPGQLQPLAPGGFIQHGTLGEVAYTNQAKTQALMLGLDRRDLINDNAGALDKVYGKMGRAGGTSIAKYVYGTFLNNGSFFTSGNGTALTGGGTAFGMAGLKNAAANFAAIRDPDGELMGVAPRILLVPTALETDAWSYMNSDGTNATTTANAPIPSKNPFAGRYRVVSSPYLQDTTLTGYSSAAWYLLADPNDVAVIEVVFLNGKDTPTVESTDADFNQMGIQIRVWWDYGAALQEYRGGVRSAGS